LDDALHIILHRESCQPIRWCLTAIGGSPTQLHLEAVDDGMTVNEILRIGVLWKLAILALQSCRRYCSSMGRYRAGPAGEATLAAASH
jgi:hypothetical protein